MPNYIDKKELFSEIMLSKGRFAVLAEPVYEEHRPLIEAAEASGDARLLKKRLKAREEDLRRVACGALSKRASQMLYLIAREACKKLPYVMEDDRNEAISGALTDFTLYWRNFDPEVSTNAFAYYTEMAKKGFAKGFKRMHRHPTSKHVSISKMGNIYNI